MQCLYAGDMEIDLSLRDQFAHAIDAVLRGAKTIAVMHQSQPVRHRREIERPVQRQIAAARDQHVAAAQLLDFAHRVKDRLAFIFFDAGNRRTLRHKTSAARRDHHHRRNQNRARICRKLPAAVVQAVQRLGHFAEMELRVERLDLLQQPVRQLLTGDHAECRECHRSAFPDRAPCTDHPRGREYRPNGI